MKTHKLSWFWFVAWFVTWAIVIISAICLMCHAQDYVEPNCSVLYYCGEEPNGTDPNCGCIAQFNKPRVDPSMGPAIIDVDIRLAVMAQQWLQQKPGPCPATPWVKGRGEKWSLKDFTELATEMRRKAKLVKKCSVVKLASFGANVKI